MMALGALGLTFGKDKSKSESTTNINKTETTQQNNDSTKQGLTFSNQNTSQVGSSAGTSASTQEQTGTQTGTTQGTTTSTTNLFGADAMAGLESLFTNRLANAQMSSTGDLGTFDANAYVTRAKAAATEREGDVLDTLRGGLSDQIGGGLGASSMAQLLFAKGQADSSARVGQAVNEAEAAANQIGTSRAQVGLAADAANNNVLAQLGELLKGASATASQAQTQGTTQSTSGTTTGSTNTTEASSQNTNTQTMESVLEQIASVLNGTTNTTGTESTKQKGSATKIGASLSLGK